MNYIESPDKSNLIRLSIFYSFVYLKKKDYSNPILPKTNVLFPVGLIHNTRSAIIELVVRLIIIVCLDVFREIARFHRRPAFATSVQGHVIVLSPVLPAPRSATCIFPYTVPTGITILLIIDIKASPSYYRNWAIWTVARRVFIVNLRTPVEH